MRVPLLSGTQLVVVEAPDDAVVLVPPEPAGQTIADVGAAVRDAFRFPLSGPPLAGIVSRGGQATIVTDVPALPLPSAPVSWALYPSVRTLAATRASNSGGACVCRSVRLAM